MISRFLCLLAIATPMVLAEPIKVSPALFRTPEFAKKFVGSYGFLPKVEPKVDADEARLIAELSELLAKGQFKQTEQRLLVFISERKNPTDPNVEPRGVSAALIFTLGNLYYQNNRLADAEQAYKTAIKRFGEYRRAHKNLALLYARSERLNLAKPHLLKAIDLGDTDHLSFGLMGHAMLAEGKSLAAESAFRQASLLKPDEKDWQLGLVQALLVKEDWKQAAAMMQSLLDSDPQDSLMWRQQANCYLQMGEVMRAAENFEILRLKGLADESSLNTLGDIYANQEEHLLALGAYLGAMDLSKDVKIGRSLKSAGYLLRLNAPAEAAKIMTKLREKAADRFSQEDKISAFIVESDIAAASKEYAKAAELLKKAIEINPTDGSALVKLGDIYYQQLPDAADDKEASLLKQNAKRYFKLALEDSDKSVAFQANLKLGQVLVKDQKYLEALPYIKAALRNKEGSSRSIEQYLNRVTRASEGQVRREEKLELQRAKDRKEREEKKERDQAAEKEAAKEKEAGAQEDESK